MKIMKWKSMSMMQIKKTNKHQVIILIKESYLIKCQDSMPLLLSFRIQQLQLPNFFIHQLFAL